MSNQVKVPVPSNMTKKQSQSKHQTNGMSQNGSSIKMQDEIQAKVNEILEENKEQIALAKEEFALIHSGNRDEYEKANETYQKAIDDLYMFLNTKIDQVNEKYGPKLFKLKEYYDIKTVDKSEYNSVLMCKNEELNLINEDFNANAIKIKEEYNQKIKSIHETFEAKPELELLDNIQRKIKEVLSEQNDVHKSINDSVSNDKKTNSTVSNKGKK